MSWHKTYFKSPPKQKLDVKMARNCILKEILRQSLRLHAHFICLKVDLQHNCDDDDCPNYLAHHKKGVQGEGQEETGDQRKEDRIGTLTPGADAPTGLFRSGVLDARSIDGGMGFHSTERAERASGGSPLSNILSGVWEHSSAESVQTYSQAVNSLYSYRQWIGLILSSHRMNIGS